MARAHKEVVWTFQAHTMLDEAVGYIAQDFLAAAPQGAFGVVKGPAPTSPAPKSVDG